MTLNGWLQILFSRARNPQVESWISSVNLRAYLVACEKALVDGLGALSKDSPEARWLRRANGYLGFTRTT